jgi:hypothetical protein
MSFRPTGEISFNQGVFEYSHSNIIGPHLQLLEKARSILIKDVNLAIHTVIDALDGPASVGEVYQESGSMLAANFARMDQPMMEQDFYTNA